MDKKQRNFIEVLNRNLGILSKTLVETGVDREDYLDWLEEIEFYNEVQTIEDTSLDYVESRLLRQIEEGNVSAITFYLRTKGKDRGYG